jgi:hypothetical protein
MTPNNLPTEKQAKAMNYILQGEQPKEAMIKAGYSLTTAEHPKENLLQYKGPQQIIKEHQDEFTRLGITPIYLAKKTKEWLDATKIKGSFTEPDKIVPDYPTQLAAAERIDKIWGITQVDNSVNVQVNITPILGKDTKTE